MALRNSQHNAGRGENKTHKHQLCVAQHGVVPQFLDGRVDSDNPHENRVHSLGISIGNHHCRNEPITTARSSAESSALNDVSEALILSILCVRH